MFVLAGSRERIWYVGVSKKSIPYCPWVHGGIPIHERLILYGELIGKYTRWWFHIFFTFTPTWGDYLIWRAYFQMGWFNHQLVYHVFYGNIWHIPSHPKKRMHSNQLVSTYFFGCFKSKDYFRWISPRCWTKTPWLSNIATCFFFHIGSNILDLSPPNTQDASHYRDDFVCCHCYWLGGSSNYVWSREG